MSDDLGLSGVVPFRFECQRSGNCCKVTGGYAWLAAGEPEQMAAALGLKPEVFSERHVRSVNDPTTGRARLALRDGEASRCSLLEGDNVCSVYEARPEHCRQFPFWESVLKDAGGFERARSMCPGIVVEVDEGKRERAFRALEALYSEVDTFVDKADPVCIVRGKCCRFEDAGHRLYATGLEADYAARVHVSAPPPEAEGRCPYHVQGRCTAREGRPLGCRTYFCDTRTTSVLEEAHEFFLTRIRQIEKDTDYPHSYGPFPAALMARGVGQHQEVPE